MLYTCFSVWVWSNFLLFRHAVFDLIHPILNGALFFFIYKQIITNDNDWYWWWLLLRLSNNFSVVCFSSVHMIMFNRTCENDNIQKYWNSDKIQLKFLESLLGLKEKMPLCWFVCDRGDDAKLPVRHEALASAKCWVILCVNLNTSTTIFDVEEFPLDIFTVDYNG